MVKVRLPILGLQRARVRINPQQHGKARRPRRACVFYRVNIGGRAANMVAERNENRAFIIVGGGRFI